ncbi:hypothetical protein ANME2D_00710 [Candidatus Methanoperedens nitroreducens]|uniref:Uncharacterized protein n=1 Tax=Candidatus Methanoperedens nitratireducens TaxID=1392998 RepID=A0A062VAT5_9EURY|nr:hypothetical protein [Candidatus Methanoperedens nitroreducens]KCZ73638.1 hypothetical protein ANME2D_00710 [Candidatus Methanoperedens nitroreducens]MDJ1422402.1 hypothetical protein [Candidatus Methanoperedens sp.]
MQLNKETIKKLERLKAEAEAKISAARADILKYITLDPKYSVIIDPSYREEAKSISETMFALRQESVKLEKLIDAVKEAARTLDVGNFEFGAERMRYVSSIATNDQTLKQGVIKGVLSREKCANLEAAITEAESKLKKHDEVTAPLVARLDAIPDFPLPAPQR